MEALRLAAGAQLLLLAVLVGRDHRRSAAGRSTVFLAFTSVCYVLAPLLLTRQAASTLTLVALRYGSWRLGGDSGLYQSGGAGGASVVAATVAVAVVADALRRVRGGERTDLVVSRLRLRRLVLLIAGGFILVVLVGELARALAEQEYRVRRLINSELGFRNFSAFLNHFRIEEARTRESSPIPESTSRSSRSGGPPPRVDRD